MIAGTISGQFVDIRPNVEQGVNYRARSCNQAFRLILGWQQGFIQMPCDLCLAIHGNRKPKSRH